MYLKELYVFRQVYDTNMHVGDIKNMPIIDWHVVNGDNYNCR
jgi:hypothetical protein